MLPCRLPPGIGCPRMSQGWSPSHYSWYEWWWVPCLPSCWFLYIKWTKQPTSIHQSSGDVWMCSEKRWKGTKIPRVHTVWWLKSCTTWDVWNPINSGIFTISTGAGFRPSTVVHRHKYERKQGKSWKQLLDPSFLANLKGVFVEGPKPQHSSNSYCRTIPGMNLFCR